MAFQFLDQLSGSVANLISLQCWAATLSPSVRVVEPFMISSIFGANLSVAANDKNVVRLRDLFDMKEWNGHVGKAPLVSWDYFLKHAPRKLILVDRECPGIDAGKNCMECNSGYLAFKQSAIEFAKGNGFEIIRKICHSNSVRPEAEFRKLIYLDNDPSEVVVLFNLWGGVNDYIPEIRMALSGSHVKHCYRGKFTQIILPVSKKIIADGKNYIKKYLPEAKNKGFISVMMRMEHVVNSFAEFNGKSNEDIWSTLNKCFDSILEEVEGLKIEHDITSVLFTVDCRKQGSFYFGTSTELQNIVNYLGSLPKLQRLFFGHSKNISKIMTESVSKIYTMLFGNSSTIEEWDDSFDTIASFSNPGYIGLLQKHLAAKGKCLITAGGGSFQRNTRLLHSIYHPKKLPCVTRIKECGNWQ